MLTAVHGPDTARTVFVRIDRMRGRTERSGTDRAFAERVLARAGHGSDVVVDASRRPFRFRYRTRRDGPVSLVTVSVSTGFSGLFRPAGRVVVAWSTAGGVRVEADDGTVLETRPGTPALLPTVGPFTVQVPPGTLQLLSIDRALVERVLRDGSSGGRTVLPESGAGPDESGTPALRRAVEAVAVASGSDTTTVETRATVQWALVEAVVGTFGVRRPGTVGRSTRPSTVELAEAYLEEHCALALTLADVCDAVGVSPRTLQTAFVRTRGTSPMAYLQQVRLDRVHAALLAADRREASVSEIAVRWGFRHLGRFSGTYLQRFGEYPAQTLRATREEDGDEDGDGAGAGARQDVG
ncbi:AraC family transcriptional regulator [Curtobacterium sp. YC1]|uniref:AraC family transcriptional regulator n=1 Tax=Curtobacterium sp. YC1 TaxID=2795488 RepID=UPI0018E564A9|nr:AraC family transcriptional regulator [Curtobacterium sp. YC1]QQD77222.1 AraC family transcriptional regulator [Curtobacterium sp. YC1]